ncbi:MAG: glycosyltransferase family 4 protein [Actinobacteria bacterium]|nr:MAG: glycosyltransferase family 4 protein [Actinomycetota bacterium]
MRVAVLTTSYPRFPADVAGRFVADAVQHVRARGVEVEVVGPEQFRHFGIAYGHGIVANLRRRPWLTFLVPALLASFVRAARRVEADLLHAHWLSAGWVAAKTGKPYVVQVWGTDVELARRAPWLADRVLRGARSVIAASTELASAAQELGASEVRVIPSGVDLPDEVGQEAVPPEVLFAGRLSAEKGVLELVEAARGLNLVVAGDGPLRREVPQARGFVPHGELDALYRRAAVVACPSRREGFGVACLEAMAHGRPVVATDVGGLRDLVVDQQTGLVIRPRDPLALRAALDRLLADRELRRRLGAAGRERARRDFSWQGVTDATLDAYAGAVGTMGR